MTSHNLADSRHANYGAVVAIDVPPEPNETDDPESTRTPCEASSDSSYSRNSSDDEDEDDDVDGVRDYKTLLIEHLLTTPFIVLTFTAFIQAVRYWSTLTGGAPGGYNWNMFLWGGTGWSAAFVVRKPIYRLFVSVTKMNESASAILTYVIAGVLEELTRLGWLRFSHGENDFLAAYWLGLGWAAAEALCFLVQRFLQVNWYKRKSEEDMEAQKDLTDILGTPLNKLSAWWGVMWRGTDIMAQIGYSCWLAYSPLLFCPVAIIHVTLNVAWYSCLPTWGIPGTSYATLIVSMSVFLIGLALFGQII